DIKPENILLQNGHALVADFGIALAVEQAGGVRMTQTGLSLGTPQYMSPEQAMGDRHVDARADIYALGAVTYEMLAGEPPFTGPNGQAIIAKVITEDAPSLRAHRRSVPPHVEAAVSHALEKLPADRFASARAFADALLTETAVALSTYRLDTHAHRGLRARLIAAWPWAAALLLSIALGTWGTLRSRDMHRNTVRFFVDLPHDDPQVQGIAFAPDASSLVYAGPSELMLRSMSDLSVHRIPGTTGGTAPFFSPDGAWIGFIAEAKLKKVRISGGATVVIADSLETLGGAAWTPDGQIIFTGTNRGLATVSANGGRARIITSPAHGERHMWPDVLPDGHGIVFTIWRRALQTAELAVATTDGKITRLGLHGVNAHYVDGHLVFAHEDGSLASVPFDPATRRAGSEDHLANEVAVELVQVANPGAANYAVSASGSLVYVRGALPNQAVVVDRAGTQRPLALEARTYARPRYSPDGRRVLFDTRVGAFGEIWLYDIGSATMQRLFAGDDAHQPEWSPDGKRVAFTARNDSTDEDLFSMPLDGSAPPETVLAAPGDQYDATWTPDARSLIFISDDPFQNFGIVRLDDRRPSKWLDAGTLGRSLLGPRISPDGHWIAYWSNQSGRDEVYVRAFPEKGGVVQISSGGGTEPVWSHDGHELFYRQDDRLIAASLATRPGLIVTGRHLLFAQRFETDGGHAYYDVSPDGKSFIFLKDTEAQAQLVVVLNWSDGLMQSSPKR
ncbi:MAG TPA: protein kinase, partial [Gemmatimonadaceae bacterium]|nr:protein kinase [Gemmatimonadaceae bacterium]